MVRIAIWGVNDGIVQVIRESVDPNKAEIVAFLDSKTEKLGRTYMGVPVISCTELGAYRVDHVIVAALSAYEKIKRRLNDECGVPEERVHPIVWWTLTEYCIGALTWDDFDIVREIYFKPAPLIEVMRQYQEIYACYKTLSGDLSAGVGQSWYNKGTLISHACGGVVNGERLMYSNSAEALAYSFQQSFKLIECDVVLMTDGSAMLEHEYSDFYKTREKGYTPLSVKDILSSISEHPEVNLLVDVKWETHEDYAKCIEVIDRTIGEISVNVDDGKRLKSQVIMEVYNEETIRAAYAYGYKMFFIQYRNPEYNCYMKTAILCHRYNISVVGFGVETFLNYNREKFLKILTDKGVRVYCFSTDSVEDYHTLKRLGVQGIFTNYLTIADVN